MGKRFCVLILVLFPNLQAIADCAVVKKLDSPYLKFANTCMLRCSHGLKKCKDKSYNINVSHYKDVIQSCKSLKYTNCTSQCTRGLTQISHEVDQLDSLETISLDTKHQEVMKEISRIQVRCENLFDDVVANYLSEKSNVEKSVRQDFAEEKRAREVAQQIKNATRTPDPVVVDFSSSKGEIKNLEKLLFSK